MIQLDIPSLYPLFASTIHVGIVADERDREKERENKPQNIKAYQFTPSLSLKKTFPSHPPP